MTDWPQGAPPSQSGPPAPGWWLASDGRYYPPEQAPSVPPPTPPGYQQQYSPYAQQPQQTNGLAIASMVLGILWIYWIGSILALIFGYVSKSQIDKSGGRQGGRGMAIAGIVLGWIGVGVLALVIAVAAFAVNDAGGFDDYNSDPVDGFCNDDRIWQDPDC